MLLRPYGVVIRGHLELGVELLIAGGEIAEIRPHTGIPEPYVVSAAFVNAHSHLEYRGMQGQINEREYWPWLRELTRLKPLQDLATVREDSMQAARENRATGVAIIGEHSDRPFAGEAITAAGLDGVIFQETITFFEQESPVEKLQTVAKNRDQNAANFQGPVHLSPHAYQTVDPDTLRKFGESSAPISIHVAETPAENELTERGEGLLAEFARMHGLPVEPTGLSVVGTLSFFGLARRGAQFVHCCDVDEEDVATVAAAGVTVAHCPRSNIRLKCPQAPVREMLDAGIPVGLGLDSPASSGPIDMFDEMRAALAVSEERGRPLHPKEVWEMATSMGYESLRAALANPMDRWDIFEGSRVPLTKIHVPLVHSVDDLLHAARPELVEWV